MNDYRPARPIEDTPALRKCWASGLSEQKICEAMGWATTTFQRRVKEFGYSPRRQNCLGKNLRLRERENA